MFYTRTGVPVNCGGSSYARTAESPDSGEIAGASEKRRLRSRLALPCRPAPALMRGQSRVNPVEHLVHRGLRRRPRLPAGGGARRGIERVPKRRFVDLDRTTDRGHGRRSKAVRRQLRRRLAGVDEVADRAPDDLVRSAVVDVAGQREDVGDVGGGDEALACDLSEALVRSSMPSSTDAVSRRLRPPRRALVERCPLQPLDPRARGARLPRRLRRSVPRERAPGIERAVPRRGGRDVDRRRARRTTAALLGAPSELRALRSRACVGARRAGTLATPRADSAARDRTSVQRRARPPGRPRRDDALEAARARAARRRAYRDPAFPLAGGDRAARTARFDASAASAHERHRRPSTSPSARSFNLESGDLFAARARRACATLAGRAWSRPSATGSTRPSSGELAGARPRRAVRRRRPSVLRPLERRRRRTAAPASVLGALAHGTARRCRSRMGADQPAERRPRARDARARDASSIRSRRRTAEIAATPSSAACSRTAAYRDAAQRSRPSSPPCRGPERAVELIERLR